MRSDVDGFIFSDRFYRLYLSKYKQHDKRLYYTYTCVVFYVLNKYKRQTLLLFIFLPIFSAHILFTLISTGITIR